MKIQVSYQGVTVSVEGDDVTLDMLSLLYDQLKDKVNAVRIDTRLDSDSLMLCVNREGIYFPKTGSGAYIKADTNRP